MFIQGEETQSRGRYPACPSVVNGLRACSQMAHLWRLNILMRCVSRSIECPALINSLCAQNENICVRTSAFLSLVTGQFIGSLKPTSLIYFCVVSAISILSFLYPVLSYQAARYDALYRIDAFRQAALNVHFATCRLPLPLPHIVHHI